MTKKTKLTTTLPSGETLTRTTARNYTHVVSSTCLTWVSWASSLALAEKELFRLARVTKGYDFQITTVD